MDLDRIVDYFTGRLSPQEEVAVQQWLAEHADDPEVSRILESLFSAAPESADETAVASVFGRLKARLHMASARRQRFWPLAAAAFLAAVLCLPLGYQEGKNAVAEPRPVAQWVERTVPVGATERLDLPDGSVLQLKAGTRVVYPSFFDGPERKIFVEGGIHADIAKDADHPFVISAGDACLTVLGTSFSLKSFPDARCVETLLIEGSVRLDLAAGESGRHILLRPGNLVCFDRVTGAVDIQDVDPALFGDYARGNTLYYYNETVQDIAMDLSRNFGTKVVVTDESLARSRYFAIFSNGESLDEILAAISAGRGMRVVQRDGVIYLQSSNITKSSN